MRFRCLWKWLISVSGALSLTGVNAYLTGVNAYLTGVNAYLVSSVPLFP
ncbi:hypothetical protein [Fictibacillus sp. S7]|nr:hypothetical protein [Fictibacillus sp. S7]